MLEKPDLPDEKIIACLQDEYGLRIAQFTFLPLGADMNTAVYRAAAADGSSYFVKLRLADFDPIAVDLPKYLHDQGIAQIIPPLAAQSGRLWAALETCRLIVYPFVAGRDGYQIDLTQQHWYDFGRAMKALHTIELPPGLLARIPRETYPAAGRELVRKSIAWAENGHFDDPVAARLAAILREHRGAILDLVARAERLARQLQSAPRPFVPCHSDVHAGNIFIDDSGKLYIVDWDNPILAPKERDLMFPGGAQGFGGHPLEAEETLFYRGYGPGEVDPAALAYYRCERIVQDMAVFCSQLLSGSEGGADREQAIGYLLSNFEHGGTLEIALRTEAIKVKGI
jgi:spectinomycin phosphotransferase